MLCLILNVFCIVLYISLLLIFINIRKNIDKKEDYEFMTSYSKFFFLFGFIFLIISVVLHIVSIILCCIDEKDVWIPFVIGIFPGTLTIIYYYDLLLDYEAIKGDYIYAKRLFKLKEIYVCDISKVIYRRQYVGFYNDDEKCLFIMDANSKGFDNVITFIIEKNKECDKELIVTDSDNFHLSSKKMTPKAKEVYKEIGKEYRSKLPRKIKVNLIVMILLSILTITIFIIIRNSKLFIVCILIVLCILVCFLDQISKLQKEKKFTNINLGKLHYFENKKVKGRAKYLYRKTKKDSIICAILFFLVSLLFGIVCLFDKDVSKDELELISGKVEYTSYEKISKTYNIIIGFENSDVEYRITSLAIGAMDYELFLDEVQEGQYLYLYVSKDYRENKGKVDKDRTKWTYAYEIYTDEKYYLTFEEYSNCEEKDDMLGIYLTSGFALCGLVSLSILPIAQNVLNRSMKHEYITIEDD